jgi:glutamine cyclotransferase
MPHHLPAYTQGLYHEGAYLYESIGLYGSSALRVMDLARGNILREQAVADYFAEGIACVDNQLVMLTWKSGRALIYRLPSLEKTGEFSYSGEGWGMTSKNGIFIMSNGSHLLSYRDRQFQKTAILKAKINGLPLRKINDIAYANHKIYANVLYRNHIYEMCEKTGRVLRAFDCSALERMAEARPGIDVLNGIAYDRQFGSFYITGKNWRYIFRVSLEPPRHAP